MEMTLSDGTISTFEVSCGSQRVPLGGLCELRKIVVGVTIQVANMSFVHCPEHFASFPSS